MSAPSGCPTSTRKAIRSSISSYQYTFGEKGKWSIRFEGENLGDNDYRWTQGTSSSATIIWAERFRSA